MGVDPRPKEIPTPLEAAIIFKQMSVLCAGATLCLCKNLQYIEHGNDFYPCSIGQLGTYTVTITEV